MRPSGASVTFTATATCTSCSTTPTGNMVFYDYYLENTTGTASNSSTSLTVASATGILGGNPGCSINGAGIPKGDYVTAISGTTVTLAIPTSAAISGGPVTFACTPSASMALSGGVASFATTTQVPGAHYIQAVYVKDSVTFASSKSNILRQFINTSATACSTTTVLTAAPQVLYVAANGSDSAAGTCSAPLKTVTHAIGLSTSAGDVILLRQGDTFPETATAALNGTSSFPYQFGSYVGTGITTSGPAPIVSARDTISGTWTLVSGTTYSIPYSGYPSKLCVDSVGQQCTPVLPTINYKGAFASGTFQPYDAVYDVTASFSYFSRLTTGTYSSFNASSGSWGGIPPVPTAMQTTGLANVEQTPNSFYSNGTNLYVNIGANPTSHTVQASTRLYGFDLRNSSYLTIQDIAIEGATFSGVNIQPTSNSSSGD